LKIKAVAENSIERLVLAAGWAPTPILDTLHALLFARVVMAGAKLGVFEALAAAPRTAAEVAADIGTDAPATGKLLDALVGVSYLRFSGGRYALARVARRWLLKGGRWSLHDNMLHRYLEWQAAEHLEEFVRSGRPLDVHAQMTPDMWATYQRGMRSLANIVAPEITRRMPVPRDASDMIDIGGGHGCFAVALCRRHPGLRATVLDLPAAIEQASTFPVDEDVRDRIVYRAGDALADDLGTERWDLVLMSQLVHHFDELANRELMRRVAQALRPGGIVAVLDLFRPSSPGAAGQSGALLDVFYAVTSRSGTWPWQDIADWQRQAGLRPRRPIRLITVPGAGIQAAVKPVTNSA